MELNIEDPQLSFLNISLKQRRPIIDFVYSFSLFPNINSGAIPMGNFIQVSHNSAWDKDLHLT